MALARLAEQLFIHGLLAQFEADCLLYLGLEFWGSNVIERRAICKYR
jgi:hypothetical protein